MINIYRTRILEKPGLHSNADLVRYVMEKDNQNKREDDSSIEENTRH